PPFWPAPAAPDPPAPPLPISHPPGAPLVPVPGAPLAPLPISGRPVAAATGENAAKLWATLHHCLQRRGISRLRGRVRAARAVQRLHELGMKRRCPWRSAPETVGRRGK